MKKTLFSALAALALCLISLSAAAEEDIYTLLDENGTALTQYLGECEAGDEYISGDNLHYRVVSVDPQAKTAQLELLGDADMPDVSWLEMEQSLAVSATNNRKIALYCTHSDESYIEGDGAESDEERGGIYDVAAAFGDALEERGVSVTLSDATHHPHAAAAYRRSRQTAVELLKYATTIGNEKMSKVRLLVGKGNQNKDANLSFAKQIKAVADKMYPGLIKDIYMGKGAYNQDLAPRSVLLEFGTHTLPKERVLASTGPMSEVVYKALYGGVTGSAGASDASRAPASETVEGADQDNTGAGWAIWLVVALVVGLGVFAFLSTGGRGGMSKWGRSLSEMTGGLFGKKPPRE